MTSAFQLESYAVVVDTRFTQPPSDVTLGVGIERISFDITSAIALPQQFLASLLLGDVNSSDLSLTGVTAPYAVRLTNPNAPGSTDQTDCSETLNYDPATDHGAKSREHKCGIGIGVGYVHFDEVQPDQSVDILEYAYLDVGFHPEEGTPSSSELIVRNDNIGDNSFDTIEIFSNVGTDVHIHYFEDRSNMQEGDGSFDTSPIRGWTSLPSGSLHPDEIAASSTVMGEAPVR